MVKERNKRKKYRNTTSTTGTTGRARAAKWWLLSDDGNGQGVVNQLIVQSSHLQCRVAHNWQTNPIGASFLACLACHTNKRLPFRCSKRVYCTACTASDTTSFPPHTFCPTSGIREQKDRPSRLSFARGPFVRLDMSRMSAPCVVQLR